MSVSQSQCPFSGVNCIQQPAKYIIIYENLLDNSFTYDLMKRKWLIKKYFENLSFLTSIYSSMIRA